jgi:D-alanyl-D-alanine dipeptidase
VLILRIIHGCFIVIFRHGFLFAFVAFAFLSLPVVAKDYHCAPFRANERSGEPLVSLDSYGIAGESYYARTDGLNAPYYRAIAGAVSPPKVRLSVAKKLQSVNESLAAQGIELLVWDGFRTIECQRELWKYFLQEAQHKVKNGTAADYVRYAAKYCSNPTRFKATDPTTWTVHVTGGAVDLTLRRKSSGEWLYMGSIYDDASEVSGTKYFEKSKCRTASCEDAKRNRRLLLSAMSKAGFVNYPYEWWHYDYGDQMWALYGGHGQPAF